MYRFLVFILLFAAWMIFSGLFDLFHLSLGAVSSALVTWLSSSMLFEDRQRSISGRGGEFGRGAGYLIWLIWQIVVANVHLLKLSLSPGGKLLAVSVVPSVQARAQRDLQIWLAE